MGYRKRTDKLKDPEYLLSLWKEHFFYDETSPSCLRWAKESFCGRKKSSEGRYIKVGDPAGHLTAGSDENKRWCVTINGVIYPAARVIYYLCSNSLPSNLVIDHIDRNGLNNRISNLREVTHGINMRNRKKSSNNTSGTNGVCVRDKCCVSNYTNEEGKRKSKTFSYKKYGIQGAFDLAVSWRKGKIQEMISLGLGYTENHGE